MKDLEASYNKMLADDTAGGGCHKTGKFHESIIHATIFPIKALSQAVTPVLQIILGAVLKLYQILGLAFAVYFLHDFSIKMSISWYSIYGQGFNVICFFLFPQDVKQNVLLSSYLDN